MPWDFDDIQIRKLNPIMKSLLLSIYHCVVLFCDSDFQIGGKIYIHVHIIYFHRHTFNNPIMIIAKAINRNTIYTQIRLFGRNNYEWNAFMVCIRIFKINMWQCLKCWVVHTAIGNQFSALQTNLCQEFSKWHLFSLIHQIMKV